MAPALNDDVEDRPRQHPAIHRSSLRLVLPWLRFIGWPRLLRGPRRHARARRRRMVDARSPGVPTEAGCRWLVPPTPTRCPSSSVPRASPTPAPPTTGRPLRPRHRCRPGAGRLRTTAWSAPSPTCHRRRRWGAGQRRSERSSTLPHPWPTGIHRRAGGRRGHRRRPGHSHAASATDGGRLRRAGRRQHRHHR